MSTAAFYDHEGQGGLGRSVEGYKYFSSCTFREMNVYSVPALRTCAHGAQNKSLSYAPFKPAPTTFPPQAPVAQTSQHPESSNPPTTTYAPQPKNPALFSTPNRKPPPPSIYYRRINVGQKKNSHAALQAIQEESILSNKMASCVVKNCDGLNIVVGSSCAREKVAPPCQKSSIHRIHNGAVWNI